MSVLESRCDNAELATVCDMPQHLQLWRRTPVTVPMHIVGVICGGLALDAWLGWVGQIAAIVWTLGVFTWLYRLGTAAERRILVLCALIAGIGEVVLSLVWGLYRYQFENIPLFVPPGHALLMTLGLLLARYLPFSAVWLISVSAALWAGWAWVGGFDRFGAVLFAVYLFCVCVGRARALYSTMFVLALMMELYGTALGNWRWQVVVPVLGLSQANPPFSAGAFYCLLDLLVLMVLRYASEPEPQKR